MYLVFLLKNVYLVSKMPDIMQVCNQYRNNIDQSAKNIDDACYNEINAVGPILVIKAGGGSGTERDVAVVASLSARVGSIGDNRLGGWHIVLLRLL